MIIAVTGKGEKTMSLINYEDVVDIVFDIYNEDLEDILDLLSALPKTDIVRCKDCKYSKHLKQYPIFNTWKCTLTDVVCRADDFCSYGERKNED